MPIIPKLFLAFLLLPLTPIAFADPPAPGTYQTEGDWGSMTIKDGTFEIGSIGANAHVCDLSGKIKGNKGYADSEYGDNAKPEDNCVIDFEPVPNGVKLSSKTEDACHQFCGARAGFLGTYYQPPKDCTAERRKAARADFQRMYDAKDYRHAYTALDAHFKRCGKFMHWMVKDEVRNDLAITQYHLGHKDTCLQILQQTTAAKYTNEDDLALPPADHDAYLPTAQATWFNMKKCSKQDKAQ
jgi:hypothetical protein